MRYIDADMIRYERTGEWGIYKADKKQIDSIPTADVRENEQLDTCPLYGGACGYPSEKCYECPRHGNSVEVVRCKDCRFWQDNNGGYPNMNCRWIADETPNDDDYCSFGERAEQGSTDRAEDAYYEAMDIVQEMADMR